MKKDSAVYFIKRVYDRLTDEFPKLKIASCRDGGSMLFSVPTDGYDNIVMVAPVTRTYNKEHTKVIETRIDHVDILKDGCVMFSDSYKMENLVTSILIDERLYPDMKEKEDTIYTRIRKELLERKKGK